MKSIKLLLFCFLLLVSVSKKALAQIHWETLNEPGSQGAIVATAISPHNSNKYFISGDMLGLGISYNAGESWVSCFGFKSYEMADLTFHPTDSNIVWIGTMSGPYKSLDGGRNWIEKRNGMPAIASGQYSVPIQKILIDPANSNRLIAVSGSHRHWGSPGTPQWGTVWESMNGGDSWQLKSRIGNYEASGITAATFAGSNKDIVYGVHQGKVYKSIDGGTTWTATMTGIPYSSVTWVAADPSNENVLFVSTYCSNVSGTWKAGSIYKTTNGGTSWSEISTGLTKTETTNEGLASKYNCIVVSPQNPSTIYTADFSYWPFGVYRSTDGGTTWSTIYDYAKNQNTPKADPAGPSFSFLHVDANNSNTLLVSGSAYVLKTTDAGANWKDITSIQVSPGFFKGRGYSGWVSTNVEFNPYILNHSVLQGLDAAKFWQSRDNMQSWKRTGANIPDYSGGHDVAFCKSSLSTMYFTMGQFGEFNGVAKTTDGGTNWTVFPYSSFPGAGQWSGEPTGIYTDPEDCQRVWVVAQNKLYSSTNGGDTWQSILSTAGLNQIANAPNAGNSTFYLPSDAGIYKTTDGVNFNLMTGSPANCTRVVIDPNNPARLYAMCWRKDNGGLWRYENGVWSKIHQDSFIANMAVKPDNDRILIAVTNDHPYHDHCSANGVYYSMDKGATWSLQNDGLGILRGEAVTFNPTSTNEVLFGTYGRGFYKAILPTITGSDSKSTDKVNKTGMSFKYNDDKIVISLPELSGKVTLYVTDLTGKIVVKEALSSDVREYILPVHSLTAGLYISILETEDGQVQSGKFVVVK